MPAVPITISGVLCDKYGRTIQQVLIVGEASLGGGGGPSPPEGGGGHPGNRPPGSGEYPTTGPVFPGGPIDPGYGHPEGGGGHPGNRPPGSWGGEHPGNRPPGSGEYPTTGPVIPPKPTEPPPDGGDKPPPEEGGWGFVSEWSQWGYFPNEDEEQPK